MTDKLTEALIEAKQNHSVVGLKISFEDEAATIEDLIELRLVTKMSSLPLYAKIGGCEAKTDILRCKTYLLDGIVCPMVESSFALEKFVKSATDLGYDGKLFINLETKTSISDSERIINSPAAKKIVGYTIGRSDLTASFGLSKKSVDSKDILSSCVKGFSNVKKIGLPTTMGGNITTGSEKFIQHLFSSGILDKIETRNVIMKLTEQNINNVSSMIREAIYLETLILEKRKDRTEYQYLKNLSRLEELKKRIR
jgi:4-hydroxy-2-oxoheptanedioate aldolase